jgi:hypothetical protein
MDKNKINFNVYELVDKLDEEEQLIWNELQQGTFATFFDQAKKVGSVDAIHIKY